MHCTIISPKFKFGAKDQRSRSPGTKNEKVQHFLGVIFEGARCVMHQFYASGKIKACCLVFIQPYGSMGGYLVYCVFACFFVCTVTDFSAVEKVRGMKFCMHVGLLSRQVFSPFGEDWLTGSHEGCITSGMNVPMT